MNTRMMSGGLAALAIPVACAILYFGSPAGPRAEPAETAGQMQAGEWSAARKRRYVRHYKRPAYAYRAPRYGGPDPAFDPSGRLYQRPTWGGSCVIDDGYGRFSACSNR